MRLIITYVHHQFQNKLSCHMRLILTYVHDSNFVSFEVCDLQLLLHLHHVRHWLQEHLHRTNVHLCLDQIIK